MSSTPTPWTKYLIIYWLVAAIVLYLAWEVRRQQFFDAMGLYMMSTVAVMLVVMLREQRKLMKYLKCFHLKKWEEITTFPLLGGRPGGLNSFRALGFVYGDDDLNDPMIKCLKRNFKSISPWVLVVPISHVWLILFLVYVGVLHKV